MLFTPVILLLSSHCSPLGPRELEMKICVSCVFSIFSICSQRLCVAALVFLHMFSSINMCHCFRSCQCFFAALLVTVMAKRHCVFSCVSVFLTAVNLISEERLEAISLYLSQHVDVDSRMN